MLDDFTRNSVYRRWAGHITNTLEPLRRTQRASNPLQSIYGRPDRLSPRNKHMLLILDNYEQMVEAAGSVTGG